ncbi:hypothetical protein GCM10029964_053250 [Kibdelosporangium lantanae]
MPTDPVTTPSAVDTEAAVLGPEAFRHFMSQWPTPVTVVTTADGGTPLGCTVNAMMSVSLSPPLLVVALTSCSGTLRAVRRRGMFALNVLTAEQRPLCRQFATGEQKDRFRAVDYQWRHGMPLLDEVVAATVCQVEDTLECGDHVLIIGAPRWHATGDHDAPLVFYRKGYRDLVDTGQRR